MDRENSWAQSSGAESKGGDLIGQRTREATQEGRKQSTEKRVPMRFSRNVKSHGQQAKHPCYTVGPPASFGRGGRTSANYTQIIRRLLCVTSVPYMVVSPSVRRLSTAGTAAEQFLGLTSYAILVACSIRYYSCDISQCP